MPASRLARIQDTHQFGELVGASSRHLTGHPSATSGDWPVCHDCPERFETLRLRSGSPAAELAQVEAEAAAMAAAMAEVASRAADLDKHKGRLRSPGAA